MKNKNYKALKILITSMVLLFESGSFSLGNAAFFIHELLIRKGQVCEEAKIELDSIIAQVQAHMQANNKEGYKALRRDTLARMHTIFQCQKETFRTYIAPPPPLATNLSEEITPKNLIDQKSEESSNIIETLEVLQSTNTNIDPLLSINQLNKEFAHGDAIENREYEIEPIVVLASGEKIDTLSITTLGDLSKALKLIETVEPIKSLQLIAKINVQYRLVRNPTNPISEQTKNIFASRQLVTIRALRNIDIEAIETTTSLLQYVKKKREAGQSDISVEKYLGSADLMEAYKFAGGNEDLIKTIEFKNE